MHMGIVITIQSDVFVIIAITALLSLFCYLCFKAFKQADVMAKPKGLVLFGTMLVSTLDKLVKENTNEKKAAVLAPYIGTLSMYLLVSNLIGLLSIKPPTSNYSVTLTLAAITLVLRETEALRTNGFKAYMHGFIEPIVPFIIPNFFGKVAPLISMSLRLFGNLVSGSVIMTLVYTFTEWLASMVPVIGKFNFIGPILAAPLHAYFDLFSGSIQMFIFITLTMVYIGNELPSES